MNCSCLWWKNESAVESKQFLVHADWSNLLCVSTRNEDSASIQSMKASEQDEIKAFFLTIIKISDWQILQFNEHNNQLADVQQVYHAQQKQQEQHTIISRLQNAVFS